MKRNREVQRIIDATIQANGHLHLIENDVCSIAKRIMEIEDGYFIVYNTLRNKYEVHSAYNGKHETFCFTVPFDELDARTLHHCNETSVRLHGNEIYKRMKAHNKKIEDDKQRDFERYIKSASQETGERVAFAIDQDELYEGYRRTVSVGGI